MRAACLILALGLPACVAFSTSPVLLDITEEAEEVLQRSDARARWERELPAAPWPTKSYALPKTQLLVFRGDVEDTDAFFGRAEVEIQRLLHKRGALVTSFERTVRHGVHESTWIYDNGGREGVFTLWGALQEGGRVQVAITIHESRQRS